METSFVLINSLNKFNEHIDEITVIFAEYNIFRLNTNTNFKPKIFKELFKETGTDKDKLLNLYKSAMNIAVPYQELIDFFERKLKSYFIYFLLKSESEIIGQASIEAFNEQIVILRRMYIRPSYRRMNFGFLLL